MTIRGTIKRYCLGLAICTMAITLQNFGWGYLQPHVFFFLHPAAFFASFVAGLGPGILVTFVCAFSSWFFFWRIEPGFVLDFHSGIQILVFIAMGVSYSVFNHHLQQTKKQLVRSLAVRDEFLSIASHELKTPITTLVLQLDISRMKIEQMPGNAWSIVGKYLDKSREQAVKLVSLVDDLLNVTRMESGKSGLDLERFDLTYLIEECRERFVEQFKTLGMTITFENPGTVWVVADRNKITQVVVNLLTNAMKYGDRKPVVISLREAGNFVCLSVKDHGMGIAPHHQQRIFERFERAVSARNFSGLGLGLYISNSIIANHKGRITLESEVGKGSTFTVELPKPA